MDPTGKLYIADSGNQRIRSVAANGEITTIAGAAGDLLGGNGVAGRPNLFVGLAVDKTGNVFFEEYSAGFRRIRRISPDGAITTIGGTGGAGYAGDGGAATAAQLNPGADELGNSLAMDNAGNLYVADGANNAVRVLRPVNP